MKEYISASICSPLLVLKVILTWACLVPWAFFVLVSLYVVTSALTSTSPELRAIYSAAIGQMVEGHTALTALAVKKEWLKPYESPVNMLSCAYSCASNTAASKD